MPRRSIPVIVITAFAMLCAGCQTGDGDATMRVHYVEIVSADADAQVEALASVHGVTFGPPQADLGQARVATAPGGGLVGVRAPLAPQEAPIVRTYFEVKDIAAAVAAAEAAGGMLAYPPTSQGATGTWAIYILDGVQVGLWQAPAASSGASR